MDRDRHHAAVQRALALGRGTDSSSLDELIDMLAVPSAEVRRLAASAIGKLEAFGADPVKAVAALLPLALRDPHPQVQQYAIKGLKAFGAAVENHVNDLEDLAANPAVRDYVRTAAAAAARDIRQAIADSASRSEHRCHKCHRPVAPDEHERAQQAFQRSYCDHCFDMVFLQRRNWETRVELNKTVQAADGTVVQSHGESLIAETLTSLGLDYRYDNRFRIIKGYAIRPDFYLPELDLYIEFWGMDTLDYRIGMLEKLKIYQHAGKRLVSLRPDDIPHMRGILANKLAAHGWRSAADDRTGASTSEGESADSRSDIQPETLT